MGSGSPSGATLGAVLGLSWAVLGASWALVGRLGALLGRLGPSSGSLGGLLGRLGVILGASWAVLDPVRTKKADMLNIYVFQIDFDEFCLFGVLLGAF